MEYEARGSRIDAEIAAVIEKKATTGDLYENRPGDDITEEKGTNVTSQARHIEARLIDRERMVCLLGFE